jgi:hypothetical protein
MAVNSVLSRSLGILGVFHNRWDYTSVRPLGPTILRQQFDYFVSLIIKLSKMLKVGQPRVLGA